jgi:single-strand DNA-binding protein
MAASFNKVLLMGNLTRDPQMRYMPNQNPVTEFGLACNRKYKAATGEMKEDVTFVDCTAFGRTAEIINQYCSKGKPIFIEGRLRYETWEDKNGGGKRHKLTVVVESLQLLGGRDGAAPPAGAEDGGEPSHDEPPRRSPPPPRPAPRPASGPPPQQAQQPPFSDEQQFKDDDIPF